MVYNGCMYKIHETKRFTAWLAKLDKPVRIRIRARVSRLEVGNFGDTKPIGSGAGELRLDFGPGYRVYYGVLDGVLVILLGGGDKSTQESDIERARRDWQNETWETE